MSYEVNAVNLFVVIVTFPTGKIQANSSMSFQDLFLVISHLEESHLVHVRLVANQRRVSRVVLLNA